MLLLVLLQTNWDRLQQQVGTERLSNMLWCAGIVLATLILKRPLSLFITRAVSSIANRFSEKRFAEMFQALLLKPIELLLETLLFYIAINQLNLFLNYVIFRRVHEEKVTEMRISDLTDNIFLFFTYLFLTLVVSRLADFTFYVLIAKAKEERNTEKIQLLPLMKEVIKIILWIIGAFWILGSVFNVNIPALIAGLGIGGIAIALAAKETVENFFAAFTILTDKPFHTGDLIKLGTLEGHVERIGFRSTKLRNADGSQYIIPNKKLVNENLENLTRRDNRRMKITVHLKYTLSHEQLHRMIEELKAMAAQALHVTEPVDVSIDSFGENALQLVLSYHLPDPMVEGGKVSSVKQEMNLRTYEIVTRYTGSAEVKA